MRNECRGGQDGPFGKNGRWRYQGRGGQMAEMMSGEERRRERNNRIEDSGERDMKVG